MTTSKNRSKNKKLKLYKNIEGGDSAARSDGVGRLKINQSYLADRIQYTYSKIFDADQAPSLFGDQTDSPLFILKSSNTGNTVGIREAYKDIMGSTLVVKDQKTNSSSFGSTTTTTSSEKTIGSMIPIRYFGELYDNYISGDFTRAVKYEYKAASMGNQIVSGISKMFSWIGLGKPSKKRKTGAGKLSDMMNPGMGTYESTYDEFKEKTDFNAREAILLMKQFDVFMDYINEVGKEYRQEILKFIKKNINRVYSVGEDIDFNQEVTETEDTNAGSQFLSKVSGAMGFTTTPAMLQTYNKKSQSLYGDVLPPEKMTGLTQEQMTIYKKYYDQKIKDVNNTIYNSIRSQVTNDPNNPSLIIPSPFWFGGDIVKVTNDLDIRTTLPQSLYTETLALQKAFENEVFNNKTGILIRYLQTRLADLFQQFKAEGQYIDEVTDAANNFGSKGPSAAPGWGPGAIPGTTESEDTKRLQKEYERQIKEDVTLHLTEKTFNPEQLDKSTLVKQSTVKGIKYVLIKTKDIVPTGGKNQYQEWLTIFVKSEEYPEFVTAMRGNDKNSFGLSQKDINDNILKTIENELNPGLDMKTLQASKTFYNADVFEDEDPDSVNYDLIQELRKQEDEYNKVIADLKAPFEVAQAERKKQNEASLKALKDKIGPAETDMYKELDKGMAKNRQNRIDKKNDKMKADIAEQEAEDEDSALASLTNYKSCTGIPKRKPVPERIYQDVNLQDIIKKSGKTLSGGKKHNSIAHQVYLFNKRFIGDFSGEGPHIKYNSARKKGGATDSVNKQTVELDPSLGVQGITSNYIDFSALQKEVDDMNMATDVLNVADSFVGFIPVVGDFLSAGISIANLVMADEIAKKQKEMEEKQKENERLLDSFYSWKNNMQEQVVLTLSTQENPEIFVKMKKSALDSFRTLDPENPPTKREIAAYSKQIDDERNNIITGRQNITDQITQNSTDILGVIADTLEEQDNAKTALIDEGFKERKAVIDEYTTKLKDYIKKFIDEQKTLAAEDKKAQEQENQINDIIEDKKDELNEEAKTISQLKGYSGCSGDVKSNEEMRDEALQELKEKQKKQEEALAQGTAPKEGLGKIYKKYNKNSIANQIYLLNSRFIKTF